MPDEGTGVGSMAWCKRIVLLMTVMGLLIAGTVLGDEGKSLMIVFTADTDGETNPCG